MRIAETLHMPIKEVVQLDVLEMQMWMEWFQLQNDKAKESMSGGKTGHRSKSSR